MNSLVMLRKLEITLHYSHLAGNAPLKLCWSI
uniref:Uncharacterized protein n=1 Tax=Anguilla anguilla TaxID=7936 RepID=A0A0E9VK53_ANGAN